MKLRSILAAVTITVTIATGCQDRSQPALPHDSDVNRSGPLIVHPGDDLQQALDQVAKFRDHRVLILRPGVYRPKATSFCLLAITAKHDGVILEGDPGAVLSGKVMEGAGGLSHVLYCGDGLSSKTIIRGLTITEAVGQPTRDGVPIENFGSRTETLRQGLFYFLDGGAVKIFGKSAPVFQGVDFVKNQTTLCGGAVSIEQQGFCDTPATFQNCRFIQNRCPATGSAIDVLQGSSAKIENCLFVRNISNYGMQQVKEQHNLVYNPEHGSGALTVFPDSVALVDRCTFVGNWNAVDDKGNRSRYSNSIFSGNDATDGSREGHPYEIDIIQGDGVVDCIFHSAHPDLRGTVSLEKNIMDGDDPDFDESFVPRNNRYADTGYRLTQNQSHR